MAFDDLDVGDDGLHGLLVGDATKPWRGRAFERVLALTTLAALDIERGRCDLALPTLKNAVVHDARVSIDEQRGVSDAVVTAALVLRCLADGDGSMPAGSPSEVARAREDLRRSLRAAGQSAVAVDVERRVRAPGARLVLTGFGPSFARAGVHGEELVLTPREEDDGVAGVIALGPRAARSDDELPEPRSHGIAVWSSTTQATAVRGRPFDAVRAKRASDKDAATSAGRTALSLARSRASSQQPWTLVGSGVLATGGAGLLVLGAVIDARADDRFLEALPGRVWIVAP